MLDSTYDVLGITITQIRLEMFLHEIDSKYIQPLTFILWSSMKTQFANPEMEK